MTKDEALKRALEALENEHDSDNWKVVHALQIIKEALAQPEHIPDAGKLVPIEQKSLKDMTEADFDSAMNVRQPEQEPAEWVLRITNRRIEVNENVEVTEAAQKVLTVLQSMLAPQPKQEPVANITVEKGRFAIALQILPDGIYDLYTAPPKRKWVGLTDDERASCWRSSSKQSAINIEAKLKELNHD